MRVSRRALLGGLVAILTPSFTAFAQDDIWVRHVKGLVSEALPVLRANLSREQKLDRLLPVYRRYFDTQAVARGITTAAWREFRDKPEELKKITATMDRYVVAVIVEKLTPYAHAQFTVGRSSYSDHGVEVESQAKKGEEPVNIVWHLTRDETFIETKIIDVSIDVLGRLTLRSRGEFTTLFQRVRSLEAFLGEVENLVRRSLGL